MTPDQTSVSHPAPWSALITLPVPPDAAGVARVLEVEKRIRTSGMDVHETIPAFNRLLVIGQPESWDPAHATEVLTDMASKALLAELSAVTLQPVTLRACYHPDLAPDLSKLAQRAGLAPEDIARHHAAREYTVLATGFAPGFAYLGDVDAAIAAPRRTEPRTRVPAGSIGIADRRTAVYPSETPGGWQLIGRVPAGDLGGPAERVTRFLPGQSVQFEPVSIEEYREG